MASIQWKIQKTQSEIGFTVVESDSSRSFPTLVLIMGYGGSSQMWPKPFVKRLAAFCRVVMIDNRGTGESIKPQEKEAYPVSALADDVRAVTQAAKISQFHLLGYSLGGCIALDFAHRYPEGLLSLILMSTTAGGKLYVSPPPNIMTALTTPSGNSIWELFLSTWRVCMSEAAIQKFDPELKELFERTVKNFTPRFALRGQLWGYYHFNGVSLLPSLNLPTFVITGDSDRLAPPRNSALLASHIRGAELISIPNCEHAPQLETGETLASIIEKRISRAFVGAQDK